MCGPVTDVTSRSSGPFAGPIQTVAAFACIEEGHMSARSRNISIVAVAIAVVGLLALALGGPDDPVRANRSTATQTGLRRPMEVPSHGDPEDTPPVVVEAPEVRDDPAPPPAITSGTWTPAPATSAGGPAATDAGDSTDRTRESTHDAAAPSEGGAAGDPSRTGDPLGYEPGGVQAHVKEYLDATRRIVLDGAPELTTVVTTINDHLLEDDAAGVASYFAADEDAGEAEVPLVLGGLPPGSKVAPPSSVGVFAVEQATVYFAYCLLTWEDGGIESVHTIVVPLRFVDGEWRLTTLDERVDGIVPVQIVEL
jgi:hypothetical protein